MPDSTLPIRFTQRRLRSVGMLLMMPLLSGGSFLAATDGAPYMWGGVLLFGLSGVFFVWELVQPQQLLVDREGLTATSPGARHHIPWDLVERFEVLTISTPYGRAGRLVGMHYRPGTHQLRPDLTGHPRRSRFTRWVAGVDAALPSTNCYGQDPDKLIDLLERLRSNHSHR